MFWILTKERLLLNVLCNFSLPFSLSDVNSRIFLVKFKKCWKNDKICVWIFHGRDFHKNTKKTSRRKKMAIYNTYTDTHTYTFHTHIHYIHEKLILSYFLNKIMTLFKQTILHTKIRHLKTNKKFKEWVDKVKISFLTWT